MQRPNNQKWMIYLDESPLHTPRISGTGSLDWTATYRVDSILTVPYGRWQYYNRSFVGFPREHNIALNKTKSVAWFVSNCASSNDRHEYATELSKYIQVDVFGKCGNNKCHKSTPKKCFEMLQKDYRFYLAFENSNCRDYITEKFFVNSLQNNVIPIVMGAKPKDYERVAPFNSYIHVDNFKGPKDLAEYLKVLESNEYLYNKYFRWKGTGEFIKTKFFCRICSLLHDHRAAKYQRFVKDINKWWAGDGVCVYGRWNDTSVKNTHVKKSPRVFIGLSRFL